MRKTALLLLTVLFFSLQVFADEDVLTLTVVGTTDVTDVAKAKAEALKDALDKGSLQVISQLIGQAKTDKSLKTIKTKVFAKRAAFLQSYKAQEPTTTEKETSISVTMKMSTGSLRDVLAKEGLLYQSEGPAAILPVFRVHEKKDGGRQYVWWYNEANATNVFLRDQLKDFVQRLEPIFRSKNFYLIDPIGGHYVQWLPEPYRLEYLSGDDLLWFGEFFKATLVIGGEVTLEPSGAGMVRSQIRLTAYHTSNGRIVAEVSRNVEVGPKDWDAGVQEVLDKAANEVGGDLVRQVVDEWNKGIIGASLYKIVVRGLSSPIEQENFKKQLMAKFVDVKKIRERLFEAGRVTFEADITGGAEALGKRLETTSFQGFKIQVDRVDPQILTLRWSK